MINKKQKIIIANWKMNPVDLVEAENLIKTVRRGIKKSDDRKVIICPPSIYLSKIKTNSHFDLGIQNIFWEDKGAYTGEVSVLMAKNLDVKYAIVGHSERRLYMKETNEMINAKIVSTLKNNLKVVLCIGESLAEKNKDRASEIIERQIREALKNIKKSQISNLIIAYEPIWAIGTGQTPSQDEVMSMSLFLKKIITNLYDRKTAENLDILYGGSVNSQNALDFVDSTGMNGLLVGGASLNASEFVRIVNLFG
ncbi:MAG: triose-phosphate isomerase [Candidatus Pacebacteria bacterium]|nr:triose-phosphate isomerase [Candidatus Paceibacterota bacterium]